VASSPPPPAAAGDWEHLKVYVCQEGMLDEHDPARSIVALQYSQHTWLPTYDCTKGGWPGERRPRRGATTHSEDDGDGDGLCCAVDRCE
jgi:hypothetical protein